MHISEFDYELPEELIAQHPLPQRDASRMLIVDRSEGTWRDSSFVEFPSLMNPGDVVVINNTRVFPARLVGRREGSGGRVEILLIRECEAEVWDALVRPGGRLKPGAVISFGDSSLRAVMLDEPGNEIRRLQFSSGAVLTELIEERGEIPLPPYIKRSGGTEPEDRERYQTVFARERGAIAAPTAGLHFTPEVFEQLRNHDVQVAEITLHVGYGTFEPVRVYAVQEHRVKPEVIEIKPEAAKMISTAKAAGQRVQAVGTTTTRALESVASGTGAVTAKTGMADLTIIPGYRFRVVDGLLTNFHLPQSSLLLLVSAFAGKELILAAYRHAVAQRYRFYSYGDCMLII